MINEEARGLPQFKEIPRSGKSTYYLLFLIILATVCFILILTFC